MLSRNHIRNLRAIAVETIPEVFGTQSKGSPTTESANAHQFLSGSPLPIEPRRRSRTSSLVLASQDRTEPVSGLQGLRQRSAVRACALRPRSAVSHFGVLFVSTNF